MSHRQARRSPPETGDRNLRATAAVLAATILIGGSACSADDNQDDSSTVLLDERFEDDTNGWGGGFQSFDAGDYVWELPSGQTDSRAADTLIAVEDEIASVVVTMTFVAEGAAHVGVDCSVADIDGQADFYHLLLTDQGVVIRKASFGDVPAVTLAEADEPVLVDGADTELTATCTRENDAYTLQLAIDDEAVLEAADDDPLGAGAPGIVAGAAPWDRSPDGATIRFRSYLVLDTDGAT